MILQFKTADQIFMADIQEMKWARISAAFPEEGAVLEHGELKPQGMMVYTMYPRTKEHGLCTFGITCIPLGQTITVFLTCNKEAGEITDFTLPVPLSEIRYEVLSTK